MWCTRKPSRPAHLSRSLSLSLFRASPFSLVSGGGECWALQFHTCRARKKRTKDRVGGGGGGPLAAYHWDRQKLNGNKKTEALAGVSAGVDVPQATACWGVRVGQMDGCREVFLSSLHLLHSAALLQWGVCFSGKRGDGKPGGEWGVGCSDAEVLFFFFYSQPRCIGAGIRSKQRLTSSPLWIIASVPKESVRVTIYTAC